MRSRGSASSAAISPVTEAASGRARPRIGLLGNPGDLYGGTVLAATIDAFETVVDISRTTFYAPPAFLSDAAELQRLAFERVAAGRAGCALTLRSDVPLQSGLSGSSAILVATLRALDAYYGLELEPLEIARIAWEIERDDLGVIAGPQDRVIQTLGGLVLMDFGGDDPLGAHRTLDPALLPPLLIAWPHEPGQPSGDAHHDVWQRVQQGDPELEERLGGFAALASTGVSALERGDAEGFADAIDANFDLRASIFGLGPAERRLVDVAREAGGAAKYCGSGGSIVAMARPGGDLDSIGDALEAAGAAVRRRVRVAPAP